MALSNEQEQELRQLLQARREEVEEHLRQIKERSRPVSLDDPIGRVSRIDAIQHQEMALAGLRREEDQLQRLQDALDRLERHAFGDCERCGGPIGWERLLAMLDARSCIRCAR